MKSNPKTKQELVEALTEDAIRARLSLGPEAVKQALRRDGPLPAWWYDDCDKLAVERGFSAPRSLFSFGARKPRYVQPETAQ